MAGHGHKHHEDEGVITGKVVVSDLLQACPQAEAVLIKHLGKAAIAVPGARTESIEFLCAMNDYHEYILVAELNEVCKVPPLKVGHF